MGFGDEIIVTGRARQLQQAVNKPVVVVDRHGNIRSHLLWQYNPRIAKRWDMVSGVHRLVDGPGVRAYIEAKTEQRWLWKDFACPVGEIYFSDADTVKPLPEDLVIIEPNNKPKASPNKDWGRGRWQELVFLLKKEGLNPVQLGDGGSAQLPHVGFIHTPSFYHACLALAGAKRAVLPEGGLHHAAAALGVRGVVIYGGFISPRQTGYNIHVNLFTGGEPCGMRIPCKHCEKALGEITPELVVKRLMEVS